MYLRFLALSSLLVLSLTSCSQKATQYQYPKTQKEIREERAGSLISGRNSPGFALYSSDQKKQSTGSITQSMVHNYIWRAALDTISFMPIATSDSAGGVITTHWYEDPTIPNERFKLNVLVLSNELRVDAVKVTVFKQKLAKNHQWLDAEVNPQLARDLEDNILTRARQLRVRQEIK